MSNQRAGDGQRMGIVTGHMISNAGVGTVHFSAAQGLGADLLAGGGLDQRRTRQKDGGLLPDHDGFIRHGGHVGAACGAEPHHHRQLRDILGRHAGLVVEDATKVIPVGEHLILHRQKGAAGIHQIEAGETQPLSDGLGTQVFFHGERVVGTTLHGGVVHHQHAEPARDPADAGDDTGGGYRLVIDLPASQRRQFEKRGARVQQLIDALAGQQLATGLMAAPPPSAISAMRAWRSSTSPCMAARLAAYSGLAVSRREWIRLMHFLPSARGR